MTIVYYTGINAKPSGKHTKGEFLEVMRSTYLTTHAYYALYGESHNPYKLRKFTFTQWVKWSGASVKREQKK